MGRYLNIICVLLVNVIVRSLTDSKNSLNSGNHVFKRSRSILHIKTIKHASESMVIKLNKQDPHFNAIETYVYINRINEPIETEMAKANLINVVKVGTIEFPPFA